MKNAVDLNRILLNFKLYQVDIKKVLTKKMQNSTFYRDNLGEQKILQSAFCRLSFQIQNFGNHGAIFRLYWVCYKPPFEQHGGWNI